MPRKSSMNRSFFEGATKLQPLCKDTQESHHKSLGSMERAKEPQGEPTNQEPTNRPRESHKSLREPRRATRTESQPRARQRATRASASMESNGNSYNPSKSQPTKNGRNEPQGEPQPPQPSGMENTPQEPRRANQSNQPRTEQGKHLQTLITDKNPLTLTNNGTPKKLHNTSYFYVTPNLIKTP